MGWETSPTGPFLYWCLQFLRGKGIYLSGRFWLLCLFLSLSTDCCSFLHALLSSSCNGAQMYYGYVCHLERVIQGEQLLSQGQFALSSLDSTGNPIHKLNITDEVCPNRHQQSLEPLKLTCVRLTAALETVSHSGQWWISHARPIHYISYLMIAGIDPVCCHPEENPSFISYCIPHSHKLLRNINTVYGWGKRPSKKSEC